MVDKPERKILDMIEEGQLSAEEGLRLINAMQKNAHQEEVAFHPAEAAVLAEIVEEPQRVEIPEAELKRMKRLKRWWVLPFGIGLLITALGAIWMYLGFQARGFGFSFWLAWIPFLVGIFIVAISFQTSRSVWLHLRIKQSPGEKPERISISLPLPITLSRWFLNTFGSRIPGLRDQPYGDISEILKDLSPEEPFYIHVHEEDGEEVEIYIG